MRYLIIVFCLLVAGVADGNTFGTKLRAPAVVDDPGGESSCPPFATSVILSWNGDNTSGLNDACNSSEVSLTGVNTNIEISDTYGEAGSNGAHIGIATDNVDWSQTPDQYINGEVSQTIWLRVYIESYPVATNTLFEAYFDDSNTIQISIATSGQILAAFKNTAGAPTCYGTNVALGGWIDLAYSWDRTTGDHSIYDAVDGWDPHDDTGEISGAMASGLTQIIMGNGLRAASEVTDHMRVDRWAIVDGYKAVVPW